MPRGQRVAAGMDDVHYSRARRTAVQRSERQECQDRHTQQTRHIPSQPRSHTIPRTRAQIRDPGRRPPRHGHRSGTARRKPARRTTQGIGSSAPAIGTATRDGTHGPLSPPPLYRQTQGERTSKTTEPAPPPACKSLAALLLVLIRARAAALRVGARRAMRRAVRASEARVTILLGRRKRVALRLAVAALLL